MVSVPALLVAAPASGHGKTTVVAALARLHRRRGRRVRVFKCGPDFLDPMVHELASGSPCENIDLTMCGEDDARRRLARAAAAADLILIEGVMGLNDSAPSGAELARRLGLPILLIVDAAAMAGSFGAIAWGVKHYRDGAPITHAFANRVGSAFHAQLCRESLPEDIGWAGHLPRDAEAALPACEAVWLPGGYPELCADAIAGNRAMAASLRDHVERGMPLLAECGGMMACFERLHLPDGETRAMFGLLPGASRMHGKLAGLGLLSAELPEGRLTGHTFHFSITDTPLAPIAQAATLPPGRPGETIFRHKRLTASYMHFYFPSNSTAAARLFLQ